MVLAYWKIVERFIKDELNKLNSAACFNLFKSLKIAAQHVNSKLVTRMLLWFTMETPYKVYAIVSKLRNYVQDILIWQHSF